VSRFRDLKAETGGPPNDDKMTVSCGHEPSCVSRFMSGFKAVLDHACHHGQILRRDSRVWLDQMMFANSATFSDGLISPKIRLNRPGRSSLGP
jgi:hypothetical protein